MSVRYKKGHSWIVGSSGAGIDITANALVTAGAVEIYDYNKACLLSEISTAGNPTNIQIWVEVSSNQSTDWYRLTNDNLDNLVWTAADAAGVGAKEGYYFDAPGAVIRLSYLTTGCDVDNYFTIILGLALYSG